MKSTVEQLEPTRVKITAEVPYDELKPAVEAAAKKLSQQVNIPGFRRGKVPMRVLENHIGRAALIEQAVNDSLDGYYQELLVANEITPLGPPSADVTEWPNMTGKPGGKLAFAIEVDTRPEIELPAFSDITLTAEKPEVTDEDVEERLTEMRQRFATLKSVDRKVADNDFVSIDMEATIDGETVDSVSGVSYQLGSGQMLDGIDEALTGMAAGETTTFTSTLAGGEHEGEEAEVTVTVHSVKEQELPEADDDFAQLASEFDTIEEFRSDLAEQAEKDKLSEVVFASRDLLLEELKNRLEVPVPAGVIDAEVERQKEAAGDEKVDEKELRSETEDALRTQLILDAVVEKLEVEVEQDELLQFMLQQAQMYGIDPQQFIQAAAQTGQIGAFSGELTRNKALIEALKDVKVVDEDGKDIDINSVLKEDDEAAEDNAQAAAAQATEPAEEKSEEKSEDKAEDKPKKATAKKTATKKSETKKSETKKAPAKKAPAKKTAAKKSETEEEGEAKKAPAKKAPAKKAPAKKTAATKTETKKAPAKKSTAKKSEASEDKPAKKTAAKKPAAKKTAAKKADTPSED